MGRFQYSSQLWSLREKLFQMIMVNLKQVLLWPRSSSQRLNSSIPSVDSAAQLCHRTIMFHWKCLVRHLPRKKIMHTESTNGNLQDATSFAAVSSRTWKKLYQAIKR